MTGKHRSTVWRWILPTPRSAEEVHKLIRREWTCPWCGSERVVARRRQGALKWVELPVLRDEPKWVCEGCALEVYYACNADDFETHVELNRIKLLAAELSLSVREFRLQCLRHQIQLLGEPQEEQRQLRDHLSALFDTLQRRT